MGFRPRISYEPAHPDFVETVYHEAPYEPTHHHKPISKVAVLQPGEVVRSIDHPEHLEHPEHATYSEHAGHTEHLIHSEYPEYPQKKLIKIVRTIPTINYTPPPLLPTPIPSKTNIHYDPRKPVPQSPGNPSDPIPPNQHYIPPPPTPTHHQPHPAPDYIPPHPAPDYTAPHTALDYTAPHTAPDYTAPHTAPDYTPSHPAPDYTPPHPAPDYTPPSPPPPPPVVHENVYNPISSPDYHPHFEPVQFKNINGAPNYPHEPVSIHYYTAPSHPEHPGYHPSVVYQNTPVPAIRFSDNSHPHSPIHHVPYSENTPKKVFKRTSPQSAQNPTREESGPVNYSTPAPAPAHFSPTPLPRRNSNPGPSSPTPAPVLYSTASPRSYSPSPALYPTPAPIQYSTPAPSHSPSPTIIYYSTSSPGQTPTPVARRFSSPTPLHYSSPSPVHYSTPSPVHYSTPAPIQYSSTPSTVIQYTTPNSVHHFSTPTPVHSDRRIYSPSPSYYSTLSPNYPRSPAGEDNYPSPNPVLYHKADPIRRSESRDSEQGYAQPLNQHYVQVESKPEPMYSNGQTVYYSVAPNAYSHTSPSPISRMDQSSPADNSDELYPYLYLLSSYYPQDHPQLVMTKRI